MAGRHGIECGLPITTNGSARLGAADPLQSKGFSAMKLHNRDART
jgi:hypothetical protein